MCEMTDLLYIQSSEMRDVYRTQKRRTSHISEVAEALTKAVEHAKSLQIDEVMKRCCENSRDIEGGLVTARKFSRFLNELQNLLVNYADTQRQVSEQSNYWGYYWCIDKRMGELEKCINQLEAGAPDLQHSIEIMDDQLSPLYSIYEHNFNARYFHGDMIRMDTRFVLQLVSGLQASRDIRESIYHIQDILNRLENVIPSLIRQKVETFEALDFMNLVKQFPEKRLVEATDEYKKLQTIVSLLRQELSGSEMAKHLQSIIPSSTKLVFALDDFSKRMIANSEAQCELEYKRNAQEVRLAVIRFICRVLASVEKPNISFPRRLRDSISEVNEMKKVLSSSMSNDAVESIARELQKQIDIIEHVDRRADGYLAIQNNILRRIQDPVEVNPRVDYRLLEEKRRTVRTLADQVAGLTEKRKAQTDGIIQLIHDTSRELSGVDDLSFNSLCEQCELSAEVKWRKQVIARMKELIREKRERLKQIRQRTGKHV